MLKVEQVEDRHCESCGKRVNIVRVIIGRDGYEYCFYLCEECGEI